MPKVTQLAKTDAGYYVTTLPTPYSSHWPPLFPVACSEPGIQEALSSSFISFSRASWLRPWQSGQRAEGRGHRGRPYSGTCGYNSARVMQAVSLHGLQPHLSWLSPSQAGIPGQPVDLPPAYPSIHRSHRLDLGTCSLPHRHTAHSAEPDTVSAFKLFAVSGEDWRVNRP